MEQFPTMKPLDYYDVSIETGFLPSKPPLRMLPDAYFKPWEEMMQDYNGLLLAGKLREKIHKVRLRWFHKYYFFLKKNILYHRCLYWIIID